MQVKFTGTVTATGASMDITTLGFRPRYVKVTNHSSGGLCSVEWQDTMAAASGFKEVTDGTKSVVTSAGITPLDNGFTLGALADVNVATEILHFIAFD
jgi:hypothetical protein